MAEVKTKPIPSDYDSDPDRFRTNIQATERYALIGDVHDAIAEQLASRQLDPILDIGCGEGRLIRPVRERGLSIVALDNSATMLQAVSPPRILGDARNLPFPNSCFNTVTALYMLYHLPEPREVLIESRRVLRPGGIFIASAPSRYNDPELAIVLSPSPMTFEAENGPEMVGQFFEVMQVERWDAPLVHLPDKEALARYLRGRSLSQEDIQKATERIPVPLSLTKRGALIFGRKSLQ